MLLLRTYATLSTQLYLYLKLSNYTLYQYYTTTIAYIIALNSSFSLALSKQPSRYSLDNLLSNSILGYRANSRIIRKRQAINRFKVDSNSNKKNLVLEEINLNMLYLSYIKYTKNYRTIQRYLYSRSKFQVQKFTIIVLLIYYLEITYQTYRRKKLYYKYINNLLTTNKEL